MKVGIAGLGTIGTVVALALSRGIDGFELDSVTSGRADRAARKLEALGICVPVVDTAELAARCDVIVECAPTEAFVEVIEPAMRAGRSVVTVSSAAILLHPELIELARAHGGHIILATGALLGLDAVRAAAESEIYSVDMITRKPPSSLVGAPHLTANNISIEGLAEPLQVFKGSAREGARGFPANLNVAASLALAGIGPDRTTLEIWADPTRERNTHTIRVDADSVRFEMTIENVPSPEKPGTGKVTALSVIAALRSLNTPLRVGS